LNIMKQKTTISLIIEKMNSMSDSEFKDWMISTQDALISLEKQHLFEFFVQGNNMARCVDKTFVLGVDDTQEAIAYYKQTFGGDK